MADQLTPRERARSGEGDSGAQRSYERERTRIAAVTLAIFWGLALISLLIPYANLALTPLFFVLGPFAAWRASQRVRSAFDAVTPKAAINVKDAILPENLSEAELLKDRERPAQTPGLRTGPDKQARNIRNGSPENRRGIS